LKANGFPSDHGTCAFEYMTLMHGHIYYFLPPCSHYEKDSNRQQCIMKAAAKVNKNVQ